MPDKANWEEKQNPHRWIWKTQNGLTFVVTESIAPFGPYHKLQIFLPDGSMYQTMGQKNNPHHWFKRSINLYKRWGTAGGFDLSQTTERWIKIIRG